MTPSVCRFPTPRLQIKAEAKARNKRLDALAKEGAKIEKAKGGV